jgi:hypothetical protein
MKYIAKNLFHALDEVKFVGFRKKTIRIMRLLNLIEVQAVRGEHYLLDST